MGEHLRSNTRQKRRKIANMTIQIYNQKKVFNEKVRKARNEKIAIRSEIISLTDQIGKLQQNMPKSDHRSPPAIPEINPEEEPEKMFSTNDASESSDATNDSTLRPVKSARDSA